MAYSLRVFGSALGTTDPPLVADVTGAGTWKRSIRANGGPWQGSFTLTGSIGQLANAFYTWLGYHVVERCGGVKPWSGLIYEMELSHAGVKRRRSLDLMANYVSVYYVDPARVEHQTTAATQAQSIARYGRKEEIDWLDDMTEPGAEAQRDRMLAETAWPWARPLSVSAAGETSLEVACCGYCFTANWRYTTQTSEFDTEQGDLTYAATTFTDAAQDFSAWDTAAPGTAAYSLWVTNDDNSLTWAYLGDVGGTIRIVDVYQDQALTTPGWNGAGIVDLVPVSYYVRGGASSLINDIASNDCEYLTVGSIDANYVPVNRILQREQRAWDVMMDAVDMGDTSGNPWRLYVTPQRQVMYEQISTTPRYYLHSGGVFDSVSSTAQVQPWLVQPAVFRDMNFTVARAEQGSWLSDARDIYVDEVEVDADGSLTLKTELFSEGDLLAEQARALKRYPTRPRPKDENA